jgi:transcriptional regulator with XRE-family HTH domain
MIDAVPWPALGTELARARHRTAPPQQQLAHRLGITQAAYSLFERGLMRPRPPLLCQLAVTLGIDVAHLAALAGYPLAQVLALPTFERAPHPPQTRDRALAGRS